MALIKFRTFIILILVLLFSISLQISFAQNIPIYTQFFTAPYIYNPAYAGLEGRSSATITYRKQWYGIEDAPVTANFIYHTPLFAGLNFGLNVTQDNYGIFKSSSALISLGYTVGLGWNHFVSFGLSGGAGFQNIDFSDINVNDPAFNNLLEQSTYLDGNAGIAYHVGNFNIGFALPQIFETATYPTQTFDTGNLGLIKNYIVSADYMLYFASDNFAFQPYALYRSYEGYDPQIEGGGIFHIKNLLWVGGSYRQDFGIAGLAGIKLKGVFAFGYSYEIPATKADGINKTSHEAQLTISFGKKNKRSKKHATFLASAKVEKPKKKKEEVIAKKEEPPIDEKEEQKTPTEDTTTEPKIEETTAITAGIIAATNEGQNSNQTQNPFQQNTPPPIEVQPSERENTPITNNRNITRDDKIESKEPALTVRKGSHPLELDQGHYVVLGAFGVFDNATRFNDKTQAQGYSSQYGYNSEKELFYVVIHYADNAKITRQKRDELRKKQQFAKAWYLLVE